MWKLQLPRKQRMGLMAIFGVGFVTVAAGAIRLYYSVVTVESDDFTCKSIVFIIEIDCVEVFHKQNVTLKLKTYCHSNF